MNRIYLLLLGLLFCFNASALIIDKDNRKKLDLNKSTSWRFIGILIGSQKCVATLVAKDVIVTAAHCVMNSKKTGYDKNLVFHAGYMDGVSVGKSKISKIITGNPNFSSNGNMTFSDSENDWAVCKLVDDLGSLTTWSNIDNLSAAEIVSQSENLNLMGYSPSFSNYRSPFWTNECEAKEAVSGLSTLFYHDCDSTLGTSGAPIFHQNTSTKKLRLIGIHQGQYDGAVDGKSFNTTDNYNLAVSSSAFADAVIELSNN